MNAPQLPTKELPTEVDGEYQLAVDFDNIDNEEWLREVELQKRWAENERIAREKWRGDEGDCLCWLSCGGHMDWEWWDGLKSYERRMWLQRYEVHAKGLANPPSPGRVAAEYEEAWQRDKATAERWAQEIVQAFAEGRPCPYKVSSSPLDKYNNILNHAIDIARIPRECLDAAETKS
jgi:hypothetical protein